MLKSEAITKEDIKPTANTTTKEKKDQKRDRQIKEEKVPKGLPLKNKSEKTDKKSGCCLIF